MISEDQVQEFSKRLAIDAFTVIREYIQIVFLSILYSSREGRKIYFKGGTAIRLLLKSNRFSEDLDFTAELTARELDVVVNETIKKVGFIVPSVRFKRADGGMSSYTGILSYQPQGMKYPLNIHLDFSLREKSETQKQTVLETDFPIAPQPIVRHMDWPEVLAEKIRAFLVRSKGRDVYDLWFMLGKGVELNWDMINRKVRMYNIETSLQDLMDRIGALDEKIIKKDLGKFLPAFDRGLVEHLKGLTMNQLVSRQGFTIRTSENIDYSKIPSGSFSGTDKLLYDLKKTKVMGMERQDENTLVVKIMDQDENERTGYIRARTKSGVRELETITLNASSFKGQSYDDLINHQF